MKKNIFAIFIILVLALTSETAARNIYYWEDFMDTAEIKYDLKHGKLEFYTKILEYDSGKKVDNGSDTEFYFNYGILRNSELYYYSSSQENYKIFQLKQRVINRETFALSGMVGFYFIQDDLIVPSIKLLSDKILNKKLTLHNNFQLYFYQEGIIIKRLESGFTYNMNSKHSFKGHLGTFFIDDLNNIRFNLKVAYKNVINEQTNYILYGYYEKDKDMDNLHLENIVEFKPVNTVKLTSNIIINTDDSYNNWIIIRGEKKLFRRFTISCEYKKEAEKDGNNYFMTGLSFML
ncbi:hypothetical protein BBF96_05595 [Anoxybacter fermentans]|uniref:Uncharacterized protein n=1 Tax=Anoxybacter fermentans TaxID=1323375 RepID=A0A3Q9HRI1_9FIRM|nr:hypothetical protein [Anoxybacter fermentans]AZR72909.1 hypothetical protein BBF96_05595 [Anoxybacter fermentans]